MRRPTDEQLLVVWRKASGDGIDLPVSASGDVDFNKYRLACGRAAFIESCRVALDVPTKQECHDALYMQGIQKKDADTIIRSFTANRLRLLTEPTKDEAAIALEREFMRQSGRPDNPWDFAKMVEAVRKADAQ